MRKQNSLLVLSAVLPMLLVAQNDKVYKFVNKYKDQAIAVSRAYNMPASIIMVQAVLESGLGESKLAIEANNLHGHKTRSNGEWTGRVYQQYDDELDEYGNPKLSNFRVYGSPEESFWQHPKFLKGNKNYHSLFQLDPTDYRKWAYGLKKAGYASNDTYAINLIKRTEEYRLFELDYLAWGTPEKIATGVKLYKDIEDKSGSIPAVQPEAETDSEEALMPPSYYVHESQFTARDCQCYSDDNYQTLYFAYDISPETLSRYAELLAVDRVQCPDIFNLRGESSDAGQNNIRADDQSTPANYDTEISEPAYLPEPPTRRYFNPPMTPVPVSPVEPAGSEDNLPADNIEEYDWNDRGGTR